MQPLKVLISREDVAKRVAEQGAQITKDFAGQSVIFVGVLKGAAIFLSDLARQVDLDSTFDFIGVSSYGNRPEPARRAKFADYSMFPALIVCRWTESAGRGAFEFDPFQISVK